jgi:putative transposase
LTHFLIDSNGNKISNPKNTRKYAQKLKIEQRRLKNKQKGSENFKKQKLKVARIHAKIADCRKDFLHKLSSTIVNENQVICVEDLAVKNMVKNRKLSKAISDAAWSTFVNMLKYKSDWYGRTFHQVNRWYPSSKTCSSCGHLHSKMPLSVRKFSCEKCGAEHDRDINAAKNILTVGQTELACGVHDKTKALVESNAQDREARIPLL